VSKYDRPAPKVRRAALLALVLLAAGGCGLDDYQRRMDEELVRVKYIDEEQKSLSDVVNLPMNPDAKEPSDQPIINQIYVFVAAPRWAGTLLADKEEPSYGERRKVPLYRYPGKEGYNLFLAGEDGSLTGEEFQQEVLGALRSYGRRVLGRDPLPALDLKLTRVTKQPFQPRGELTPRPPIRLDSFEHNEAETFKDACHFEVYFYSADRKQVAVIYQTPLAARGDSAVRQGIEYSLKTLGVGSEATKQQLAWGERRKLLKL
jgi:hypothetical protein